MYREAKDHHPILGLSAKDRQEEIRHAFRKLTVKYHRDRNLGNEKWAEEAASGGDKKTKHKRGREKGKLIVKVPPGVTQGTRRRLRGMGLEEKTPGDLFITVKIKS